MRVLINRLSTYPKYAKVLYWGKLITVTGSAQIMIQIISVICGIFVIRLLSPKEYALYTLANTMLGAMVLLSDSGISVGVMSQAGKVWQDKQKLGVVLSTGLDLRKKFALVCLLIAVPVLFYFLLHHSAGWLLSTMIIIALIPAFYTSISGTLLEIVPRLKQNILPLQKIQVGASIARLILLGFCLIVLPWAFIAILTAGLPQIWANRRLNKLSLLHVEISEKPDVTIRKEILTIVKRVLPGTIYYCLSGQIMIWLISFFGTTAAIAQVGALGRIAMILGLFNILFGTLVAPRYARLPNDKMLLLKLYLQIQVSLIILGLFVVMIVYLFTSQALWILGPNYSNLKIEFLLNMIGSFIGLMAGTIYTLNNSRGWTINPIIAISINIITITCGIKFIDISTLKGLFVFNIIVLATEAIIFSIYGLVKIFNIKSHPSLSI